MLLSPPKTLEILTAELTDDVLRAITETFGLHLAFQPWLHHQDFVESEILPVNAVHIAPLAVAVGRII